MIKKVIIQAQDSPINIGQNLKLDNMIKIQFFITNVNSLCILRLSVIFFSNQHSKL